LVALHLKVEVASDYTVSIDLDVT